MRHLGLVVVLLVAGCNMEGLPNGVGSGATSNGDGSASGDGSISSSTDMAMVTFDLATPKGMEGSPCMTACDCQDGLACFQQQCTLSSFGSVFCCESSMCPAGMFCQSGTDGSFHQCGMPGGGGGGMMMCSQIQCTRNSTCTNQGCGSCNKMQGVCAP